MKALELICVYLFFLAWSFTIIESIKSLFGLFRRK